MDERLSIKKAGQWFLGGVFIILLFVVLAMLVSKLLSNSFWSGVVVGLVLWGVIFELSFQAYRQYQGWRAKKSRKHAQCFHKEEDLLPSSMLGHYVCDNCGTRLVTDEKDGSLQEYIPIAEPVSKAKKRSLMN